MRLLPLLVVVWAAGARADLVVPPSASAGGEGAAASAPNAPSPSLSAEAVLDATPPDPSRAEPSAPAEPRPSKLDDPSRANLDDKLQLKDLPPPSIGAVEIIGPLAKTMAMLAVVLALVYLTLHKGLGKLVERQNVGKRVRVVERTALDAKRTIFLVEVDGHQMILAAGEGGVVHLKDLGTPAAAMAQTAPAVGLGARFAAALQARPAGAAPVTTGLSRTEPGESVVTDIEKARG